MTELLLIRHAETDFNRQLRFQGHTDTPLNANGIAQAERLAARLLGEPLDLVVSSDLQRAQQTARPLLDRRALPLRADPVWREQAFGVLEGLDAAGVRARQPEAWAAWQRHDADLAPPGGESYRDFHARVWQALRDLARDHAGARVAVFTHGGVLDMVWRGLHALPLAGPRQCKIPNTGLNRLRCTGLQVDLLLWGDDAHLAGMDSPPVTIPVVGPAAR
jgi:probable phosphoglycerate mutase